MSTATAAKGRFIVAVAVAALVFAVSAEAAGPGLPTGPAKDLPRVVAPAAVVAKPDLALQIHAHGLGGLSDLYPDAPGMGPSRFEAGGMVLNLGAVPVPRCEVELFLSADGKLSPDDRRLDRVAIATPVPPASGGRAGSVMMPRKEYGIAGIPPGTYFICGRVDPARAVAESREDNNESCGREWIRIHPPGKR